MCRYADAVGAAVSGLYNRHIGISARSFAHLVNPERAMDEAANNSTFSGSCKCLHFFWEYAIPTESAYATTSERSHIPRKKSTPQIFIGGDREAVCR